MCLKFWSLASCFEVIILQTEIGNVKGMLIEYETHLPKNLWYHISTH